MKLDIDYLKGKTIAFEGVDSAGKGTLCKHLYNMLGQNGLDVKVFEYINDVPIAKTVRDLMFKSNLPISEKTRELLYSAIASQTLDLATQYRKEHPDSLIIFDRCVVSMMAFQALSNSRTESFKTISNLYTVLCDTEDSIGTKIDYVFYIKISGETSLNRCPKGCDYEPGLDKLNRVITAYDAIFGYDPCLSECTGALYELLGKVRFETVNGELSVEETGLAILNLI